MALFRRNKSQAPESEPDDTLPSTISESGRKKAGPTPSRKEAEALRRQRVTRQLTPKEARKEPASVPHELGEGLRAVADPELRACLASLAGHIATTKGPPIVERAEETSIPTIRSLPK